MCLCVRVCVCVCVCVRDVHRYPVYRNTGILGSVLPVIPVSAALRYTGNGIFMTSVYRCTGIFPSVFFPGIFFFSTGCTNPMK